MHELIERMGKNAYNVCTFNPEHMVAIVKDNRPVYLNLFQFKFPVTAIASILHRLSGVFLFLLIPGLLYALSLSLASVHSFHTVKSWFTAPCCQWVLAFMAVALCYHVLAGLRHLLMDCHVGDGKESGRQGAYAVIGLTALFALWLGYCIW